MTFHCSNIKINFLNIASRPKKKTVEKLKINWNSNISINQTNEVPFRVLPTMLHQTAGVPEVLIHEYPRGLSCSDWFCVTRPEVSGTLSPVRGFLVNCVISGSRLRLYCRSPSTKVGNYAPAAFTNACFVWKACCFCFVLFWTYNNFPEVQWWVMKVDRRAW